MSLGSKVEAWVRSKYEKKGMEVTGFDVVLIKFWVKVFPKIILIPILFYLLKIYLVNYLLAKKGFETMVAYVAIILVLKPMIVDVFKNMLELKK